MGLVRFSDTDHYCWDDHGSFWKWGLKYQKPVGLIKSLVRLSEQYPDTPISEILEYGGPRTTWASQRRAMGLEE